MSDARASDLVARIAPTCPLCLGPIEEHEHDDADLLATGVLAHGDCVLVAAWESGYLMPPREWFASDPAGGQATEG